MHNEHVTNFLWVSALHICLGIDSVKKLDEHESLREHSIQQQKEKEEKQ